MYAHLLKRKYKKMNKNGAEFTDTHFLYNFTVNNVTLASLANIKRIKTTGLVGHLKGRKENQA